MTGLVLEGGGMRGLFTSGVIDVWMENGVKFDGIIGVSAGATFGCNYKSHQPGRVLRYNIRFKNEPRYMGIRSFLKTGDLVGTTFAYHWVPKKLDRLDFDTYNNDPTEFYIVCTDVETGKPLYKKISKISLHNDSASLPLKRCTEPVEAGAGCSPSVDEAMDWFRASASMPIVSNPVPFNGHKYLDGGISDSIPLEFFQKEGYERNVVILTQPKGFTKKKTKLMPIFYATMRKYPAIIKAMGHRHEMYNAELAYIAEQERLGNTLIINPTDTLPISRTSQNETKMRRVYEMGRKAGQESLQRVKEFTNPVQ